MVRPLLFAALVISFSSAALSQTPRIELVPVLFGLDQPVYVTHSRDGSRRMFILERVGRILVRQPGAATASVFLDIRDRILSSGGEQGLLGLTFHSQFSANGRFFLNYTRQPDGATVVAEYRVSILDSSLGDFASAAILLVIAQPHANHNGGMIEFGADGYLYIGMGDGGSGNDPDNRAQNVNDLLGKMLRIDIDHPESVTVPYSSVASNPFFGSVDGLDEIYATGFRNPWRFSFDRNTGELYAGDVGQNQIEEIDIVTLGGNYGWRVLEGTRCTDLGLASCSEPGFIPPTAEYSHASGRCSITGGYVYRGPNRSLPAGPMYMGTFAPARFSC